MTHGSLVESVRLHDLELEAQMIDGDLVFPSIVLRDPCEE